MKEGQIPPSSDASCNVISIAIDVDNQLLYYGSMGTYGEGDPYLYQYDISAQSENSVNVGCSVAGIAVDQSTSLIYLTTYGGSGSSTLPYPKDRLFVYDTNLDEKWYSDDIGNPAGVAVAGDVSCKPPVFYLEKVDDVSGCVEPGNYITYTITYGPNGVDHNNVVITDYLPYEVDYEAVDWGNLSIDPNYDPNNHTYKWEIGNLPASAPNSTVTLTVQVNELAEPLGTITNYCKIENEQYFNFTTADTNVSCFGGDIIYVDESATAGSNSGTSWENAYLFLQDALERVGAGCGSQIWVAEGSYQPSKRTNPNDPNTATFLLIDGIPLYGGFPSGGGRRNWITNQTILDGDFGGYNVYYVVLAQNVNGATILDGFTIKNGYSRGIYCLNSNPNIINCNVGPDNYIGIHCSNSDPNIINCKIEHNNEGGISCSSSNPNIINCVIVNNGNASFIGGGIYCHYSSPKITNCTLIKNTANEGGGIYNISYSSPIVKNCILWDNSPYEISGSGAIVTYSDINQVGYSGNNNIKADPCFYNPSDPNSYHLTADSPCIDRGNNSAVPTSILTDIDGEDRKIDGDSNGTIIVDMGADEYYWSLADFNHDEIVNFIDYAMFANAWQTSPGNPGYNDIYDLQNNNSIDYADLALFCKDWLWIAAWNQLAGSMMMGEGTEQGLGFIEESYLSAQAEQQPVQVTQLDTGELLKWLEELWLDPERQEVVTEEDWLAFVESVKSGLE